MNTKYPNLEEFLGCYFHQDWMSDDETAWAVIERYLSEWPSDGVRAAIDEVDSLLAEMGSESDLREMVMRLGCYYVPQADSLMYRDWLAVVRNRLAGQL